MRFFKQARFVLLGLSLIVPLQADAQAIKEAVRGLISMGAYRFVGKGGEPVNTIEPLLAKGGIFGGLVVVATWRQLQPTAGSELPVNNAIDQALDDVRAYNKKYPGAPLAVKLRIWAGFVAPDWAKRLNGPPLTLTHEGNQRVVGRFWSPAYREAWRAFQQKVSARYDGEPLIHEVAVTSCMLLTAEPFFIPVDRPTLDILHGAHFRDAAYKDCLTNAVDDYASWKSTRVVFPINPFRSTDSSPWRLDYDFSVRVMEDCREKLHARCVLDNHDLDAAPPRTIVPIFDAMKRLGPEIEFQTYRETPADFPATIRRGVALGASGIELWQDYHGFPEVPVPQLKRWAELLKRQPD